MGLKTLLLLACVWVKWKNLHQLLMRTEVGIQQGLDYFASSGKKCAICVYGVRRKKGQGILGGSLSFVAQNQKRLYIKVFDFCKKEVQKTQY